MNLFLEFLSSMHIVVQVVVFIICLVISGFFLSRLQDDLMQWQNKAFDRDIRRLMKRYKNKELSSSDVNIERLRLAEKHSEILRRAMSSNPYGDRLFDPNDRVLYLSNIQLEAEKDLQSFLDHHMEIMRYEEEMEFNRTDEDKKFTKILRAVQVAVSIA